MNNPAELSPKHYTQEYLRAYAAFFAHIAEDDQESASLTIARLQVIEQQAENILDQQSHQQFLNKRRRLCKLFKERLLTELQDQVKLSTIEKAEELIAGFKTQ